MELNTFSATWMRPFLTEALKSADLETACRNTQVGMGQYLLGRRKDPVFDQACRELDSLLKEASMATTANRAAQGDWRANKQIAERIVEPTQAGPALPLWLAALVNQIETGQADPFVLRATEIALDLAIRLQVQGKAPVGWAPGQPYRVTRFSAADADRIQARQNPACEQCGAISYFWPLTQFSDFSDLEQHEADDAGWTSDPGQRCEKCGARAGLPWRPASLPPPSAETRVKMLENMKK